VSEKNRSEEVRLVSVSYYEENAQSYFDATVSANVSELRARFLRHVRLGGRILDAGCGAGRDLRAFADAGHDAIGFDASARLAVLAAAHSGRPVTVLRFEDMSYVKEFDGIWACASLLHLAREALPDVFGRCARALRPGGAFYLSFKHGATTRIEGGRTFTDMTEPEARLALEAAGCSVVEVWISRDVRPSRTALWLNVIALRHISSESGLGHYGR
jgi:SAM-dependent methyltransferase